MNRRPQPSGPRLARSMAALFFAAVCVCLSVAPASAATRYIFAVFKGDAAASEKLSIYTSTDGLNFTLLSDTGYGGPTGILRDPSIMKHSDGKYYVAHTTNSWTTTTNNFAIATSTDLVKWTHVVTVPAQVANVQNTWAPEWFKDSDGSVNLLVNIDTTNAEADFRTYKFTATDSTLTKWSAPVTIGIGPNVIDTFIVKIGSTYHAIAKNETTKYIEHATASNLTGPWTWIGTGDWAGWGSGKEGPALFQLASGQWRLFLDCYSGCGYLVSNGSSSDFSTWSATSTVPGELSGVVRHGTVLREDDTVDAGPPDSGGADSSADLVRRDASASGGATGSGGAIASGGAQGSGGSLGSGGTQGSGGTLGSGGARSGGATGSGGAMGTGGSIGTGGSAGVKGTGGTSSSGGAAGGQPDAAIARDAASAGNSGSTGGSGGNAGTGVPANTTETGCSCALGARETKLGWSFFASTIAIALLALSRRRKQRSHS